MNLVQVVDVGTTNVKTGIVTKKGEVVEQNTKELKIERPEAGSAEHDPNNLVEVFCEIIKQTNEDYRSDIKSLVLTGYLFGFMPFDRNKDPLTGMITLLDERTKVVMEELENRYPLKELYRRTGCPPLFVYSFAKILWLKKEKPDVYRNARYFGDLKSFLIYKLTGKFVTEQSTASATQLLNIHRGKWDEKVLEWLEIEEGYLPDIIGESKALNIREEMRDSLGLTEGTNLLPGVYDGGAMVYGMGGYGEDLAICNLGTTAMLRKSSSELVLDTYDKRRLQTYKLSSNKWVIGGSLNNAGIALKWLKSNLAPNSDYDELIQSAVRVEPGGGNLLFLPFLTGERDPRMGNLSTGMFFGLKEHHSREHLTRAVMEGVVFALGLILDAMEERDIVVERIAIGGSGSTGTLWPQLVADILEVPVQKSLTVDATLIGGAMLSYRKNGTYHSIGEASKNMVRTGGNFAPRERYLDRYRNLQTFFNKLVDRAKPLFEEHAKLINSSTN